MVELDETDFRILGALQRDGALTNDALADRAGLSASQCWRRVQRLRAEGVVGRTVVLLDPARLGLKVTAYALIRLTSHAEPAVEAFRTRLLLVPEVIECAKVTGEADYLVKFQTTSLEDYDRILTEQLLKAPEVASVRSSIVLDQVKSTTELPLPRHRY